MWSSHSICHKLCLCYSSKSRVCLSFFAISFDIYLWLYHTRLVSLSPSNEKGCILLYFWSKLPLKNKQLYFSYLYFSVHVRRRGSGRGGWGGKNVLTVFSYAWYTCDIAFHVSEVSSTIWGFRPTFLFYFRYHCLHVIFSLPRIKDEVCNLYCSCIFTAV